MDRSQIIGLVLMMVFITIYFQFFAPEPPQPESGVTPDTASVTSSSRQTEETQAEITPLSDSAKSQINEMKYGLFSSSANGTEKETIIENDKVKFTFTNKGAIVKNVVLKGFEDFRGNELVLLNENLSDIHLYVDHLSRKVDLSELYFTSNTRSGTDTTFLTYQLNLNEGRELTYQYSIPKKGYEIGLHVSSKGLHDLVDGEVQFAWNQKMNRLELDFEDARNRSTVKYRLLDGDVDELSARSTEKEEETLSTPINWLSFRQKFFTSAIIFNHPVESGYLTSVVNENDTTTIKNVSMAFPISKSTFLDGSDYRFYFGPNNYSILKTIAPDFEENVDLGWSILSWINKFAIIPIFHFLEDYISNYGIIIIIIVFLIRIVLAPLTYKSHMGMAKMRVMKPELDEIKEKHGGDMQKAQQEQMALYQKVGINPLSGCIPMLLQMPILFAMFYFFPNSIELRQKSFLWANDLSTYDSILDLPFTIPFYGDHVSLFTLLMTASTILYTWSNSQVTTVQGPMKSLQYIMPVMFLFFLNSYSSGLTFYYFVSNIVSFGQIALFRKFIDEDKIKATLEENKKKNANKKKSKFQSKLEEAMKANEQARKNKKNKK